MRSLIWFKEDLRILDNPALHHACEYADEGVLAVYVIDTNLWRQHHVAACRVDFILRGLAALSKDLAKYNINLTLLTLKKSDDLAKELFKLAEQQHIDALFFNIQYEVNEAKRDEAITTHFVKNKLQVFSYHEQTILPPGCVLTQQEKPYTIFTPFKKSWLQYLGKVNYTILAKPKKSKHILATATDIPTQLPDFISPISAELWPAGEAAALKRLKNFIDLHIEDYAQERDYPALDNTSKLSPYLNCGMISARQCFHAAFMANEGEAADGKKGINTWINELIWREFYKNILIAFPHVAKHQPFKEKTKKLAWLNNPQHLLAWQQGQTGYPLVDAAMRQLLQTGWMHNRLRMVTAMFLAKTLFLDWRLGEQYFMEHLIDGDLAANNGGWQWSASTGTDAAPYFRIFNPTLQSERFDPEGKFIRKYCPELAHLDAKNIHQPYQKAAALMKNINYPQPILSHAVNKDKVIAAFKKLT